MGGTLKELLLNIIGGLIVAAILWFRRRWLGAVVRAAWGGLRRLFSLPTVPPPDGPSGDLWRRPGETKGEPAYGPDGSHMVWVPPGTFSMGSCSSGHADEAPEHDVEITQGFWIMQCLVTNAQYAQYLNRLTPSEVRSNSVVLASREDAATKGELEKRDGKWHPCRGREDHPVVGADWEAASDYAAHYRLSLPTEAQWEYAARGDTRGRWPWGDHWDRRRCCTSEDPGPPWDFENRCPADPQARPAADRVNRTTPVRNFEANGRAAGVMHGRSWCGALDMAGNLMEWCADWYGPYTRGATTAQDPTGPATGELRVVRGGNCYHDREHCRVTDRRHRTQPGNRDNSIGFRCVYTPRNADQPG